MNKIAWRVYDVFYPYRVLDRVHQSDEWVDMDKEIFVRIASGLELGRFEDTLARIRSAVEVGLEG